MAGNLFVWGIDYQHQPLLDAYWTPGWTAQAIAKDSIQVPQGSSAVAGFPQNLVYVNVTGNFFDTSANPTSGYLTFWPSSALTFTANGSVTYMPQRFSGMNQSMLGINQMSDSKIYLWYGQLNVSLLATDNANMSPSSFSYHVKEHYFGGRQYDIVVPSADASTAMDINSLIIPGTICSVYESLGEEPEDDKICIPVSSSQYIAADVTETIGGTGLVLSLYEVDFAFISGPSQPQSTDWHQGSWSSNAAPYVAQILMGPNGLPLSQGTYRIWVRVIAPPQEPVIPVGWLTIY